MSEMSVPGVGKYDKLVETLMKKERVPREKAQENVKKYEQERTIWTKIARFSTDIRETARNLYSFNNPFVEKIVVSSNERAVTATASRDAGEQKFKIRIDKIAQADSFLSKEISKDYQVPSGLYTFTVGDKSVSVHWGGGKYRSFMHLVNKRGKDILSVSEIKTSSDSHAMLFESKITGAENRLVFLDDALSFALKNELVKKNAVAEEVPMELQADAGTEAMLTFSHAVSGSSEAVLKYTAIMVPPAKAKIEVPQTTHEEIGFVSFKDITVHNAPSEIVLPENMHPSPPLPLPDSQSGAADAFQILSLESLQDRALLPLPALENIEKEQRFSVPLHKYGGVTGFRIRNTTDKAIKIQDIVVFDPNAKGEFIPVHPVSVAQDASFRFEDIPISRPQNSIGDLIPGVTVQLHDTTEGNESISIKPDTDTVKNAIIELVAKYNRLLAEINIVTHKQQGIIDEITYFTDDEQKTAKENLGLLFGDRTLSSFKSKLRGIVGNVYRKNADTTVHSLAQIGISTKSDMNTGINAARLRGYLEIDEKKLDAALKNDIQDVRFLFGYDVNNDILVDDGVAYQLFSQIAPYVQRGGIFVTRTNGLAAQIKTGKDKIIRYDKELEKKEAALKYKYNAMDATLKRLQRQSESIENFNRQNKN